MSTFPIKVIKVLLATDGSGSAELAATTSVSLATLTGSELHLVYVLPAAPLPYHHCPMISQARSCSRSRTSGSRIAVSERA